MTSENLEASDALFGELLRRYRQGAGYSMRELGERIHYSAPMISRFENNSILPQQERLAKLLNDLELTPSQRRVFEEAYRRSWPTIYTKDAAKDAPAIASPADDADVAPPTIALVAPVHDQLGTMQTDLVRDTTSEKILPRLWPFMVIGFLLLLVIFLRGPYFTAIYRQVLRSLAPSALPARGAISFGSAAGLNPALTWQRGGALESEYTVLSATSINLTAGANTEQYPHHEDSAPLLAYPASGDFVAQVRLDFDPNGICCRHAGLGVRATGDHDVWVRITKDHARTIQSDARQGSVSSNLAGIPYQPDRVYLRIERRGKRFTLSFSPDRVQWEPARDQFDKLDMPDEVELFLVVYSQTSAGPVSATFSDFTLQ